MGVDPSRTHIVYSGIDTHTFHPGSRSGARAKLSLPPDKPLIVFAGNLVPVKGLDILAAALARLASLAPPFHCVLIGDGPLRASLNARFDALALGPFVRLLGARPQNELADWYRAADCVVLPSRSEGIPNVLLEAAACGTPTVASSVGGVPEVCDPAGLVPPCDPMALCERLRLFLNNTTRPGTHARFKPGSWQDSASRLAAVLHDILPASPARRAA
jgi:glycosyltransferase involved in cell wall biosynthesis